MSEPFTKKNAISTELYNVNREKHKCKNHGECRLERESGRKPIRSLKSLSNKIRNVREFAYVCILYENDQKLLNKIGDLVFKQTVCCVGGKVKHYNRLSTTSSLR